ncbi:hypothetical protein [Paenibacillus sp. Soil750]|uniref:hypothetical protein n=1 Tax=Paenibacillus sp. Soil750 TaxID=1736398 RepID=UPI0006F604E3|nr:hypothetical protein [Paenibacillus sp. Soil750]KRE70864.1 hypothetical protein ASL11_11260 [Paenibacillus sp. Soil750]
MAKDYTVNAENLGKVQQFFQLQSEKLGNGIPMSFTVVQIAEDSNVALATAHKALKELANRGVISVIKGQSRREAIQYIYRGSSPQKSLQELEAMVNQLENENKILREKLTEFEKEYGNVQVITVDESLQIVVKRK